MPITINGSGTITGASTLATAVVSPTLTTPIVTTTMGVGNATPAATGAGITFPATQSSTSDANTLDDYEEGTFLPTVYGVSTAGTTTFSLRDGNYTKIGNLVTLTLNVGWTNATGTGQLAIGALPFTAINYSAVSVYNNGLAFTASNQLMAIVESGTTYISMNQFTNAGTVSAVPVDTSVGRLMLSVSYLIA